MNYIPADSCRFQILFSLVVAYEHLTPPEVHLHAKPFSLCSAIHRRWQVCFLPADRYPYPISGH